MLRDLRFGLRILRRHPSFACAAIAVLAVGIGAVTAVFSVLRGVLITTLPYRDPGALVLFRADLPGMPGRRTHEPRARRASHPDRSLRLGRGGGRAEGNLTAGDVSVPMNAAAVSANFLDTLGVPPALGRPVERAEAVRTAPSTSATRSGGGTSTATPALSARIDRRQRRTRRHRRRPAPRIQGLSRHRRRRRTGPRSALLPIVGLRRGSLPRQRGDRAAAARCRIETARAAVDAIAKSLVAEHPDRYRTGPVRLSLASLDARSSAR